MIGDWSVDCAHRSGLGSSPDRLEYFTAIHVKMASRVVFERGDAPSGARLDTLFAKSTARGIDE